MVLIAIVRPTPAQAHSLATDGSIGAVLHIDPDDDPVVSQPSSFFFEFKDKKNKLSLDQCSCTLTITETSKKVADLPLLPGSSESSSLNASTSFTFGHKGIYHLQVTGKPIDDATFQAFSLNYDIRVARETGQKSSIPQWLAIHFIHYIGVAVILGFFIVLSIKEKLKSTDSKPEKG